MYRERERERAGHVVKISKIQNLKFYFSRPIAAVLLSKIINDHFL